MIEADDVFKAEDFQSIKLLIHFTNVTTSMKIRDNHEITLEEIGEGTLVLGLPSKKCNVRHSVMVEIEKYDYKTKKYNELFSMTGKVLGLEETDDPSAVRATLECVQYDEKSWQDLLGIFSSRQNQIMDFFKSVKGY